MDHGDHDQSNGKIPRLLSVHGRQLPQLRIFELCRAAPPKDGLHGIPRNRKSMDYIVALQTNMENPWKIHGQSMENLGNR